MEYKLRVCPFCGGRAEFIDGWFEEPMAIRCTRCEASIIANLDEDKGTIIEQWNTRPILDEVYSADYDERIYTQSEIALWLLKLIEEHNKYED